MIPDKHNRVGNQVALVRPVRASLAWLADAVKACQAGDFLAPVTVVAPSPYIAAMAQRTLAEMGCANVRLTVQLRPIAERVGRAGGARGFDQPLTGPIEAAAIRLAVRETGGSDLQRLADHRSLQESIGALFRDLGHLDDAVPTLASLAANGSVAAGATRAYSRFRTLTMAIPDVPSQLRLAAEVAEQASAAADWIREIGALVVYLPARLDAADLRLLEALGRHVQILAGLAHLGDEQADGFTHEAADRLACVLDTQIVHFDHPSSTAPDVSLLSAPDPDEGGRAIVRRIIADLEAGVPLWRMAVLYSADNPYGPLVRESLDAAGLPWHSALGRPAAAGWAARSLLGLLGLREQRFAREAVLEWLVSRPPSTYGESDQSLQVPISAWDRLSRRAQVLDGTAEWVARLQQLIQTLELEEQQRDDWRAEARGHESDADAPRPPTDSEHARAMAAMMLGLANDTTPPPAPATWDALVDWASHLRQQYVAEDDSWPTAELAASAAVDEALESLRGASVFESTTTVQVFDDALASTLESRRLPEGEAGVGVLVGPLGSAVGASFDRVYVLGMAEGLLPARPAADPLAMGSESDADPLQRRERQRQGERRALLASLASADGGRVVLSYARSDGAARASHPSRWLLEQAARIEGVSSLYASDLPRLSDTTRPWLERIASAYDGLRRSSLPADLADRRVRSVIDWHALGSDLATHPIAVRSDLPLGRALQASRARRSRAFTEYDGNLGAVAGDSARVLRPFTGEHGASSATAIERWAGCPFKYLLTQILRVEATERPEDEWTITPLDKGSLVHEVYEQFFRELVEQGRCVPGDSFTPADHRRVAEIAEVLFGALEAQGRTGHPLAWDNARASILADLHTQLERDEAWREADGLIPALFERTFGDSRDPETWPAAEVQLDQEGTVLRFRGAIDRVDLSPEDGSPRRALVIDYKTGGAWGFDGLDRDPVLAGSHVQLALYSRAMRAGLSGLDFDEVRAEDRFVSSRGKFERIQIVADSRTDARLDEVVRHAAGGIRAGAFLPTPGERDWRSFKNCRFCEYDRICSTTRDEAAERKKPDAAFVPLERLR